jgi:predicted restriction endonuclease
MSAHIQLIKKFLNDYSSVSPEELKENLLSADIITKNKYKSADGFTYKLILDGRTARAVRNAASAACDLCGAVDKDFRMSAISSVHFWINKYEELSK